MDVCMHVCMYAWMYLHIGIVYRVVMNSLFLVMIALDTVSIDNLQACMYVGRYVCLFVRISVDVRKCV